MDTNDLDGEYQMNQFWMTLERPVNTGGDGFDFGGRIDAAYGTDWRWYMNNGLENRLNGPDGQTYGMMLPQAYAAVGYNDLTVKLGTFEAILDYESLPAPANFFYSHSYCYTYGVPHLVTGMLADYKMDENWSVQGGFHRGWSQFEDDNPVVGLSRRLPLAKQRPANDRVLHALQRTAGHRHGRERFCLQPCHSGKTRTAQRVRSGPRPGRGKQRRCRAAARPTGTG